MLTIIDRGLDRRFPWMRFTATLAATVTLALASTSPALAQDSATAASNEPTSITTAAASSLSEQIQVRLEAAFEEQKLIGLSAGIVRGGEVVETIHLGFEDREAEIPASDDTMYRWASISKPLTAVAAMQLVEDGALDLDCDVRDYVPEFPEKPWPVTARQLLCHQGGVVHYTNGEVVRTTREYDFENPFEDTILALDAFCESPLVCEPGSKMSYTTHGYMLLGAVIERAGEARYIEQVRKRIIQPLQLQTLQPDYEWVEIEHRAVGYAKRFSGQPRDVGSSDVSWKLPGGGYISTVRDLAAFAAAMVRMDPVILSKESYGLMWTRQKTAAGEETSYGLGFNVNFVEEPALRLIGHSGSQEKTRTNMLLCPNTADAVVIMSNSQWADLGGLCKGILRLCVEDSVAAAAR